MSAADIWQVFSQTYLDSIKPLRYIEHHLFERGDNQGISLSVEMNGTTHTLEGEGNGPIDAAIHALRGLGIYLQVRSYEERSIGSSHQGGDAQACAFIELARQDSSDECYGVGLDANIVTASIKALVSGINRFI